MGATVHWFASWTSCETRIFQGSAVLIPLRNFRRENASPRSQTKTFSFFLASLFQDSMFFKICFICTIGGSFATRLKLLHHTRYMSICRDIVNFLQRINFYFTYCAPKLSVKSGTPFLKQSYRMTDLPTPGQRTREGTCPQTAYWF